MFSNVEGSFFSLSSLIPKTYFVQHAFLHITIIDVFAFSRLSTFNINCSSTKLLTFNYFVNDF